MKDNVFLLICQVFERDIGAYAHCPADILHERPHQRVPWSDRPFVYRKVPIRDECGFVNCTDSSGAVACPAGPLAVERQVFCSRRIEMRSAHGTDKIFSCGYPQGGFHIVSVGASVAGQPGEHKPEAVEQFRPRAESAAYARNCRSLMHCESGRNIKHLIHIGSCGLRHSSSRICRK